LAREYLSRGRILLSRSIWRPPEGERAEYDYVRGLLFCNAPAQVHLAPGDAATLAQTAQLREDLLDQFLALLLHIAKGGRDEDAYFAPVGSGPLRLGFLGHEEPPSSAQ